MIPLHLNKIWQKTNDDDNLIDHYCPVYKSQEYQGCGHPDEISELQHSRSVIVFRLDSTLITRIKRILGEGILPWGASFPKLPYDINGWWGKKACKHFHHFQTFSFALPSYFSIMDMIVNAILSPSLSLSLSPHLFLPRFIFEVLKIDPHYPQRSLECVSNQYGSHAVQKLQ